ncbi:COG1490 domain protein [Aspergillus leporis]|uniref:D-aminoacyl-tRNA deacylase n=1 Tax=Aspergillus leporis TaxID=41062 RepID=A0A5N5WX83_9EURO|nr:COG1490 domain protein [Aspergillus leporis]
MYGESCGPFNFVTNPFSLFATIKYDHLSEFLIMKAVIQRVKSASVTVDGELVSKIGRGLLVLAGVGKEDTEKDADTLIQRILKAKLFPAEDDKAWKKNIQDIEGEVLCVSQFTLYGQLKKGSKPDFHDAADVETARRLYDYFFTRLSESYKPERVRNGVFQAMMDVELKNDGPVGVDYRSEDAAVTIEINTKLPKKEKGENESEPVKKNIEINLPAELLE